MFLETSLATEEWRWKQHVSPLSEDVNFKSKQPLDLMQYHAMETWWKVEL